MDSRTKQSNQGRLTFLADEAMERYRLVAAGTDGDHVELVDNVADIPLGVTVDGCDAAEDAVAVELLGKGETKMIVVSGTCTRGQTIVPAVDGSGKCRALPATTGTYYKIGIALEDGADGQVIAVLDQAPETVTVS